ncbi:MAG: TGS domain-containing protein, partial [Acidianus infernus]|nr:TGS domain-containing protein [Acidianus infernus]
ITLRQISKPIVIAANKDDIPIARKNIDRLKEKYKFLIPTSAEAELALRKAAKNGLIDYIPGEKEFKIKTSNLPEKQRKALDYIKTNVLDVYGNTGVQQAINEAVFGALNMITVFPVEDERKLTDRNGNVLPDAILIKKGSTPKDLAAVIHSDLAKGFLYAIDARKKIRVGENYQLQDRDVIKIVSSLAHG